MGGTIGATSSPGVGSRFEFVCRLPETVSKPQPDTKDKAVRDPLGLRILVVDDQPANRLLLRKMLETIGW